MPEPARRWVVSPARPAAIEPMADVHLDPAGYLGRRVSANLQRLLKVDLEPLIAPFENRPGPHPWIGEHLGKWMHAAATSWLFSGDERLIRRLGHAAARLIDCQEADGYLGTYEPGRRLGNIADADWDVWTHKYCLIGLLAYYEAVGDEPSLAASVRAADLLVETFGDGPGQRSIVEGAWHMGMAPSSVLLPMVRLYGFTADPRYLEFSQYILRAWDEPGGPRVRSVLLERGRVSEVGNGKAYEMLSNLQGLLELGRLTGDTGHVEAVQAAWDDVVAHHLYVTGTSSFLEHFNEPDELPDSFSVNVGETCVTVTWLQLTLALLTLTGQAKYAEEAERTMYNHLIAAQRADGQAWSYYTPLHGRREHGDPISCCVSSGPRGVAAIPSAVLNCTDDQLLVTVYASARAQAVLGDGLAEIRLETEMPWRGGARLTFEQGDPVTCSVLLRCPEWAGAATVDGSPAEVLDGWIRLPRRTYRSPDVVTVDFHAGSRLIRGSGWNEGRVALAWGPLVLAHRDPGGADSGFDHTGRLDHLPSMDADHQRVEWTFRNPRSGVVPTTLQPFATAADGDRSGRVWLPEKNPDLTLSVFHGAAEAQSSGDAGRASINDYDPYSYVVTAGGDRAWFELSTRGTPVRFGRVDFVHGRAMVHGGWFDTSRGKPVIEAQQAPGEPWQLVAELVDYPSTDAEFDGGIRPATRFSVRLPEPVEATAIRIAGTGSWGGYPPTRIATCALLQAFGPDDPSTGGPNVR